MLPAITQFYKDTFKGVDTFDTYLGQLPWRCRVENEHFFFLVQFVRMTVVNSYAYFMELNWQNPDVPHTFGVRQYLELLLHHLQQLRREGASEQASAEQLEHGNAT